MKIYTNRIRVQATGEEYDVTLINLDAQRVEAERINKGQIYTVNPDLNEVRFLTPHKVEHTIAIGDEIAGEKVVGFDEEYIFLEDGELVTVDNLRGYNYTHDTGVLTQDNALVGAQVNAHTEIEKIDISKIRGEWREDTENYSHGGNDTIPSIRRNAEKINQIIDHINTK